MAADASEIDALRAALAAVEARTAEAEAQLAEAARERAVLSNAKAAVAALRPETEKLRRALCGTRYERKARLLDQLQLEELEATATGWSCRHRTAAGPAAQGGSRRWART